MRVGIASLAVVGLAGLASYAALSTIYWKKAHAVNAQILAEKLAKTSDQLVGIDVSILEAFFLGIEESQSDGFSEAFHALDMYLLNGRLGHVKESKKAYLKHHDTLDNLSNRASTQNQIYMTDDAPEQISGRRSTRQSRIEAGTFSDDVGREKDLQCYDQEDADDRSFTPDNSQSTKGVSQKLGQQSVDVVRPNSRTALRMIAEMCADDEGHSRFFRPPCNDAAERPVESVENAHYPTRHGHMVASASKAAIAMIAEMCADDPCDDELLPPSDTANWEILSL